MLVPIRQDFYYVLHAPVDHDTIVDLIRQSRDSGKPASAEGHGMVTSIDTCITQPCSVTTFVTASDKGMSLWFNGKVQNGKVQDGQSYPAGWYDLPPKWEDMREFLTKLAIKKNRQPLSYYVHQPWDFRNLVELIENIRWGLEFYRCDICGFELRGWHSKWIIYRKGDVAITRCPLHIDAKVITELGGVVYRRKHLGYWDGQLYALNKGARLQV